MATDAIVAMSRRVEGVKTTLLGKDAKLGELPLVLVYDVFTDVSKSSTLLSKLMEFPNVPGVAAQLAIITTKESFVKATGKILLRGSWLRRKVASLKTSEVDVVDSYEDDDDVDEANDDVDEEDDDK